MPRPKRVRTICQKPEYVSFHPDGISPPETVILYLDEYEAIRLVDYEKRTHEQAAQQMRISRATVTEIYEAARYKLADSLLNGKPLIIDGGSYQMCQGRSAHCLRQRCRRRGERPLMRKGNKAMRIAVTYEDGKIFQHFGHTQAFKFYDVENGAVQSSQVADANGYGHGALAEFLRLNQVDTLICGGIGGGAQNALAQAGIQLYGGVTGEADGAVEALLAGKLGYDPDVHCDHHGHGHGDGAHNCGHSSCSH